ncbi:MAG: hypothetical protein ACOY82_06640 [Pseudomonadota bacterium]
MRAWIGMVLCRAELLRFRGWTFGMAVAHLLVLGFLVRMVDPAQQPLLVHRVFGVGYAVLGLLLGLYQMGSYRRPSVWLNLLHRPMSSRRIALELMAAGGLSLAVAVAVPMLLAALWQETMTPRVVDLRHWLLALSAWQIAVVGYLVGVCAMLCERRCALSGLVFLLALPMAAASGFGMLALEAALAAWLIAMALAVFKPDLDAPPRRPIGVALVSLPLAMTLYLGLQLAFMGAEIVWIAQGSHPNNTASPPRGGHNEIEKTDERTRMRMAFDGSGHADAPLLREQIALSEPVSIAQQVMRLPVRHELANVRPMEFDDEARGVRWVFSHDDMRFHGYRLQDRVAVGGFGIGAARAAFGRPPLPVGGMPGMGEGDAALIAGNIVYQYDSDGAKAVPRIRLPEDEAILGIDLIGERIGLMSDRALYFFDGRDAVGHRELMAPRIRVPYPQAGRNLGGIDMIELIDGYLIVFSTDGKAHNEHGASPMQYAVRVRENGSMETLARRPLRFDFPVIYRYKWVWPSPALYALSEETLRAFAPERDEPRRWPTLPAEILAFSAALCLLSAVGAWWRSRSLAMPTAARIAWIAVCGLIGPPALGALWLLYRARERAALAPDADPVGI